MSLTEAFANLVCTGFTGHVSRISLHTADPGTTGANDSGITHATLTWTTPSSGLSTTSATFTALTGDYTHVGLWESTTFRQGIEVGIHYPAPADVTVLVTHSVGQE